MIVMIMKSGWNASGLQTNVGVPAFMILCVECIADHQQFGMSQILDPYRTVVTGSHWQRRGLTAIFAIKLKTV